MIKHIVKSFYSFWAVLYLRLISRKISGPAFIFRSRINAPKKQIYTRKAEILKSKIKISGTGNKVLLKGKLAYSDITVSGNNNRIIIKDNTGVHHTSLLLKGNNCTFYIGQGSSIGGARIICMGINNSITIGRECMLADSIEMWATDSHPIYDENGTVTNPSTPILLEDNVWIGAKAMVLKGIRIGTGAIIGMGSVVTKDIEPYSINAGNPAKCIKKGSFTWSRNHITV